MGSLLAVLNLPQPKSLRIAAKAYVRKMDMVEDNGAQWVDREMDEREIAAFMAGATGRISKPAANTRLTHPKAPPVAAPADLPQMEMVEDKGARWVDRDVDEHEVAAFMAGATGRMDKPAANTDERPKAPPAHSPVKAPPQPAGTAVLIPVSYSIPLNGKFKFKYVEFEKVKIEGELKFEDSGESGVVKTADVIGVSLDKGKLAPAKKVEVDLKKLILGQVQKETEEASYTVDPKLECKIGPGELNVALGITVSTKKYTGSAKLVAFAKESGKDWEFANFQVSPIGRHFKDEPIDLNGIKGKLSGKITLGLVLKPAWDAIGADVAAKVGRPVLTAVAEAVTAEAALVAGFAMGAAAQVFAYAKSVSEWRDVRECAQAAEIAWLSFHAGFGSAYGLKWKGGGATALRKQGAAAANALLDARLATTRKEVLSERGAVPAGFDAEWRKTMKEVAAKNPDRLGNWIERNFRRQILDGFLKAYTQEHRDDYMFEQNNRALRTLLGVSG